MTPFVMSLRAPLVAAVAGGRRSGRHGSRRKGRPCPAPRAARRSSCRPSPSANRICWRKCSPSCSRHAGSLWTGARTRAPRKSPSVPCAPAPSTSIPSTPGPGCCAILGEPAVGDRGDRLSARIRRVPAAVWRALVAAARVREHLRYRGAARDCRLVRHPQPERPRPREHAAAGRLHPRLHRPARRTPRTGTDLRHSTRRRALPPARGEVPGPRGWRGRCDRRLLDRRLHRPI